MELAQRFRTRNGQQPLKHGEYLSLRNDTGT
jgi:hypothetical protein